MKLNILLVDDNYAVRKTIRDQLRGWGYHMEEAANGLEALEKLIQLAGSENRPNIVLVDWHMPELDGIAVLEQLRADAPPNTFLPVLVLTGDSSQDARKRALAAGAKDFVIKPFEMDEVLLRIHNLLETSHLQREITAQNQVLERRVAEEREVVNRN